MMLAKHRRRSSGYRRRYATSCWVSLSANSNGPTDGVVPFCKIYDSTILRYLAGYRLAAAMARRISTSTFEHDDFWDWIEIRQSLRETSNRQSLNLHQCVVISDKFHRAIGRR